MTGDRTDLPTGWQLVVYDTIDSTSAEAKRLAGTAGFSTGVLVIQADVQTDGRGRNARTWYSPSGNLHFSVLLSQPHIPPIHFPLAGFIASVAVVEGIAATVPALQHTLACKWPNDVLCNKRKVCGLLLEGEHQSDRPVWLLIGIGINVTWAPENVQFPATSLAAEGVKAPLHILMSAVCHRLAIWLTRWQTEGVSPVRKMGLARARGIGRPVSARLDRNTSLSGIFLGLDHDGALLLERAGGVQERILAGEIFCS